jgi:hypothetical protein
VDTDTQVLAIMPKTFGRALDGRPGGDGHRLLTPSKVALVTGAAEGAIGQFGRLTVGIGRGIAGEDVSLVSSWPPRGGKLRHQAGDFGWVAEERIVGLSGAKKARPSGSW